MSRHIHRAPREKTHAAKVAVASTAMVTVLAVVLGGMFVSLQSMLPWLAPSVSSAPPAGEGDPVVVDVTTGGPTVAERTLKRLMRQPVPVLTQAGWKETRTAGGTPGLSFGFGCEPKMGFSPVVTTTRSWALGRRSLDVVARAYPSGGGGVGFSQVTDTVLECSGASLYSGFPAGVESAQVVTGQSTSLVWRRGDVLVVATTQGVSVGSLVDALVEVDGQLKQALLDVCVNPDAGVDAIFRNPYVDRVGFRGKFVPVKVERDRSMGGKPAHRRATAPVVDIPGRTPTLPDVGVLPTPPTPMITDGPVALPKAIPSPVAPTVPTATPTNQVVVQRAVQDVEGPGCGWEFTGQVSPLFDEESAETEHATTVEKAKSEMAQSWRRWQDAKVAYYTLYDQYRKDTQRYRRYAKRVSVVREAWQTVQAARDAYYTQVTAYESALAEFEEWAVERAAARTEFRAAKRACRLAVPSLEVNPVPVETPSPSASATPSESVSPTVGPSVSPKPTRTPKPTATSDPAPSSVPSPSQTATPTEPPLVCPPVRPAVLDQEPPSVPASPLPDPAAQLPTPGFQ